MSASAHGNSSAANLIIFGCGYLGTAVAEAALAQGLRVTALTRNGETASALQHDGVRTIVADLASDTWHGQLDDPADFVLNCVGSGGATSAGYRASYFEGMQSIVHWAAGRGPFQTMVYTSSTSVYPQGGGAMVDETAEVGGTERADILVATERTVRETAAWPRWFVLRLAGIYGPQRHHLLDQVRAGEVSGAGDVRLNVVHRDDIVAAVFACFRAPREVGSGVLNLADDHATPKRDVVDWLAARLGVPPPAFSGRPLAGRRAVTPDRVIANAAAKTILGWKPRFPSFREGYESILAAEHDT